MSIQLRELYEGECKKNSKLEADVDILQKTCDEYECRLGADCDDGSCCAHHEGEHSCVKCLPVSTPEPEDNKRAYEFGKRLAWDAMPRKQSVVLVDALVAEFTAVRAPLEKENKRLQAEWQEAHRESARMREELRKLRGELSDTVTMSSDLPPNGWRERAHRAASYVARTFVGGELTDANKEWMQVHVDRILDSASTQESVDVETDSVEGTCKGPCRAALLLDGEREAARCDSCPWVAPPYSSTNEGGSDE